ncbi:MAG: threonine ammonia-lyase [Deltaproteobacteria bacterium RBG_13_53_10]|nr:MAG: threonine ammonia-lyase [Deltaproteobacteria bacterium RBG_13_53_10]
MELWQKIETARRKIEKAILETPMVHSDTLSKLTHAEVYLKLENLQKTGSFKIRGALYKLSRLSPRARGKGVVAASAGNHGQGVALAASLFGIRSTIVMPEGASIAKQMATRAYGGEVVLFGQNMDEALLYARRLQEDGRSFIHPFDDEDVIAGQGTIGSEILREVPGVETIVVPVGGGGLISGIAAIVKKRRPKVKIVGVQSANAPSAFESFRQKKIVEVELKPTLADGIALRRVGEIPFSMMRKNVDEMVTVQDEEIALATLTLMERKRVVAEGAGAAPLAALLSGRYRAAGKKVVLVISGGNIDLHLLDRILEKGLSQTGRVVRLGVLLKDVPGALAELSGLIGRIKANILHIIHERAARDIPIGYSRVILVLESRGPDHIREIKGELKRKGYTLQRMS